MEEEKTKPNGDDSHLDDRLKYAYFLSVIGFMVILVLIICLAVLPNYTSSDIIGVVGLFTSIFGTIVGMFFGVQIGSKATESAEKSSDENKKIAVKNKKVAMEALLAIDQKHLKEIDPSSTVYEDLIARIKE